MRRVFIVMHSSALPYARVCIQTMLKNSSEPILLQIITDDTNEKNILKEETKKYIIPGKAEIHVIEREEVTDILASRFPNLVALHALHNGHPCWRKLTDPIALSQPEEEIIIADPDLYFPNIFDFEQTTDEGILTMWMGPHCLWPPQAVHETFVRGIKVADHVDIGVAQFRAGTIDPEWLDWAARDLATTQYRPFMFIEAILWSALAMRFGGHHLDPAVWRCWQRGHMKRLAVSAGLPGHWTLRLEKISQLKCIHVSGRSKWWLQDALKKGSLKETRLDRTGPTTGPQYVELTRSAYERERRVKEIARKMGLYRLSGLV